MEKPRVLDPRPGTGASESHSRPSSPPVSLGEMARDVLVSMRDLFREEVHVAVIDARSTVSSMSRPAMVGALCVGIALGGVIPLIAFLVIGLGQLLGGNFALSALIVGLVLAVVGAGASRYYFSRAFLPVSMEDRPLHQARQAWDRTVDRTVHQVEHSMEKSVVAIQKSVVSQIRAVAQQQPFVSWATVLTIGFGLGLGVQERNGSRVRRGLRRTPRSRAERRVNRSF